MMVILAKINRCKRTLLQILEPKYLGILDLSMRMFH